MPVWLDGLPHPEDTAGGAVEPEFAPQLCSSLLSPQSLSPSQSQLRGMQEWSGHENSSVWQSPVKRTFSMIFRGRNPPPLKKKINAICKDNTSLCTYFFAYQSKLGARMEWNPVQCWRYMWLRHFRPHRPLPHLKQHCDLHTFGCWYNENLVPHTYLKEQVRDTIHHFRLLSPLRLPNSADVLFCSLPDAKTNL